MKQVERYFYPAVFSYAPDQEIAVTFPDLDVATSGTDDTDALLSARELLGCVLCGLEEDGEDIPAPTPLADVKLEDGERAVLVDVYMPSVRLARVNRSVNRTVTLDLNGYMLKYGSSSAGHVITVSNGILTIENSDYTKSHNFQKMYNLYVNDFFEFCSV